jgi:hypothetical protein
LIGRDRPHKLGILLKELILTNSNNESTEIKEFGKPENALTARRIKFQKKIRRIGIFIIFSLLLATEQDQNNGSGHFC